MEVAAALAVVVLLAIVGVDRRDALTFAAYALLEDVVMLGNLAVIAALAVGILVVWWRGRAEKRRLAESFERQRRAEADARAAQAVEDARRRAERDSRRPAADVLTEFARRGGRR